MKNLVFFSKYEVFQIHCGHCTCNTSQFGPAAFQVLRGSLCLAAAVLDSTGFYLPFFKLRGQTLGMPFPKVALFGNHRSIF